METMLPSGEMEAPGLYDQEEAEPAPQPQRQHSKPIDAAEVERLWKKCDKGLMRERTNYGLNQCFFLGEQWVMVNNRTIQEIEWGNARERETRTTVDKFGPRTRNLLARFMPEDLQYESYADGTSDSALRSKQIRELLLQSEHQQRHWEDTRVDALMDCLFGGTSAITVDWDPFAEDDPDLATVDPTDGFEYPSGGVKLTALSILEFAIEPANKNWLDARWWIRATTAPAEAVWDRYPDLKEKPREDAKLVLGARHRTMLRDLYTADDQDLMATAVYTYYERPTMREPGQIAHVVNGQVVERELVWPFPFKSLNLWIFRGEHIRGKWYGGTLLNTARPVQMNFNHIRSTVLEHAYRAANVRLLVPEGSVQSPDAFTTDVAEIVEYQPDPGGNQPHWMETADPGRWLSTEADRLEADLDDIFHTHAISRGEQVGDRNSGLALSILAEKDDSPLTFIARDEARGHGRIGEMFLMLLAQRRKGGTATLYGPQGPIPIEWSTEDIGTNPRVIVPLKNTMPRTKVATQALIKDLLQSIPQLADSFNIGMLGKFLGVEDVGSFLSVVDVDENLITWENQFLAQGIPCTPAVYNDHAKHIAGHKEEQNTPEYQYREEDLQQLMELHIQAHEMLLQQDPQQALAGMAPGGEPPASAPPGAPGMPPMPGMELPPGMAPPAGLPPALPGPPPAP